MKFTPKFDITCSIVSFCSSAPIPSIGLAPSEPPLEALIYDFPTGASLTGFVVYFSSDEDPLVNRLLAFVNGTVLPENPSAPLQVYFRTPVFPDFCMPSGQCRSYKVSVCFESSLSKVCTSQEDSLVIKSLSTAQVAYLSSDSGPMQPRQFIDDIFLFISNNELISCNLCWLSDPLPRRLFAMVC